MPRGGAACHREHRGRRYQGCRAVHGTTYEETTATMPKNKTHSGAAKRFRTTGSGKLVRRRANRAHLLEHKPSKRTRRLDGTVVVAQNDVKKIKKLLGK